MRTARIIFTGATYHVTARTNKKDLLLGSRLAKRFLLETLARAKAKHSFEIDNDDNPFKAGLVDFIVGSDPATILSLGS